MANKVRFGLEEVHYAKITYGDDGTITYEKPVAIPGAVSLSLDNNAEASNFYADDKIYHTVNGTKSYSGDLEVALVPDSFKTDILGMKKDANGAITESGDDVFSDFALMFSVKGDTSKRRCVFYQCSVTAPNVEASTTEDSTDVQTESMTITASERKTDGQVKSVLELNDSNKAMFDKFFDEVYEPKNSVV